MSLRTKVYVFLSLIAAALELAWGALDPAHSWLQFVLLLTAVLLSSGFKVMLPRGDGTMSLNFPFFLLAVVQLSPLQAMVIAGISAGVQCRFRVKKAFSPIQTAFNIGNAVSATGAASFTFLALHSINVALAPALALAALAYFFATTCSVALVIASASGENPISLWRKEFPWYLPFYAVGAGLAALTSLSAQRFGWSTSLLLIPLVYVVYRSYNAQIVRLRERQHHLEETQALHQRTIEGLSMAIEAKDQNTHDHLFRVRRYVTEVGTKLGLPADDMQALHIAAFLHDIGKLAVPENIINKPGKLTREEFEKMKIHPVVGADILERVRFPYPVVPIVRSHHEWWNGAGYPDGLKGEEIPMGARVLTAVDCFDAMISDRPYRNRMPVETALSHLRSMAGTQFDPAIVSVMEELFAGLSDEEEMSDRTFAPLNTEVDVWRGAAPGAGFETATAKEDQAPDLGLSPHARRAVSYPSLHLIAAASQEAQALYELSQALGASLSLSETMSVTASRLRSLVPFSCMALYLKTGDTITLRHADGESAGAFSTSPIPLGAGPSGWVAESATPLLNGNATVEPNYCHRAGLARDLRSVLAVPLFDLKEGVFGVLSLYSSEADFFQPDHLRVLLAMNSKLSLALQNALQYCRIENHAETDFLTKLPNARRLFLELESELDRCEETGGSLGVIVCDLDHFKMVNDLRGHLTGNRLLAVISESFQQLRRHGDLVARMGGDEFVFLLRDVNAATLDARLQQIANAVEQGSHKTGIGMTVTASLGAAMFPHDGSKAEDLLGLADRRMYLNKQAGEAGRTKSFDERGIATALISHGDRIQCDLAIAV